jgi:hypothetical protein
MNAKHILFATCFISALFGASMGSLMTANAYKSQRNIRVDSLTTGELRVENQSGITVCRIYVDDEGTGTFELCRANGNKYMGAANGDINGVDLSALSLTGKQSSMDLTTIGSISGIRLRSGWSDAASDFGATVSNGVLYLETGTDGENKVGLYPKELIGTLRRLPVKR